MFFSLLLASNFLILSVHGAVDLVRSKGNVMGNYEILLYEQNTIFSSANSFCKGISGFLMKIGSTNLDAFTGFPGGSYAWTGAGKDADGEWKWHDGSKVNDTLWNPTTSNSEKCAQVNFDTGKIQALACTEKRWFICQRELNTSVFKYKGHRFQFYSSEVKTPTAAAQSCQNEGSRLVEIRTREVAKFLKNALGSFGAGKEFWTGGRGSGRHDWKWNWKWNGNEPITREFGWLTNRPVNGQGEECLLAKPTGWKNYPCRYEMGYICEQEQVSEVKVFPKKFDVGNTGPNEISCTANGFPLAEVRWFFGSKEVTSSRSTGMFQTKGPGNATLNVQGAKVSDEGNYTCHASNVIDGKNTTFKNTATIRVPSKPTIEKIHSCNTSLSVHWTPHRRAVGINHRIVAAENNTFTMDFTPRTDEQIQTVINGLSPSTSYKVRIKVCPGECKPQYTVGQSAVTGLLPGAVTNVTTTLIASRNCTITWNSSTSTPAPITGYQITTERTPSSTASSSNQILALSNAKVSSRSFRKYSITGRPNGKHRFGVQAQTCAGLGPIVWSAGYCITDKQAPISVQPPLPNKVIDNNGQVSIKVTVPSQENGELGCLFIIVIPPSVNNKTNQISELDDLERANSSFSSNFKSEYIAVTLGAERMNVTNIDVVLGDGGITSCSVNNTTGRTRRSTSSANQILFIGRNNKLDPTRDYSTYMVSATPSKNGILLKASKVNTISSPKQNMVPIIVAILAVLIVLVVVATVIIWRRRQNRLKQSSPVAIIQENNVPEAVIYENSEFVRSKETESSTCIKLTNFEKMYTKMMLNDGEGFMNQYEKIKREASATMGPTEVASNPELKKKNRYKNILPFDRSRVKIKNSDTGYINACYVDGFNRRQKFIATQGPLPGTLVDFWLMIAEQKCSVIVMLAKCTEAGKKKCEKYWPDYQQTVQFGPVTIMNKEEVVFAGFVRRILSISAELPGKNISFDACQYHFKKWPDHGTPPTTSCLARMHREAMHTHSTKAINSPMVVHCSAGAGRTGTFIAYDILRSEGEERNKIDPHSCVVNMRAQRVDMVQNCDQYILVHKLLLEDFLFKDTDLTASEAMATYADDDYKKKVATPQFRNLSRIQPMAVTINTSMEKLSPYARMKVELGDPSESGLLSDVDASYIETDDSNKFIASTEPTEKSVGNFWMLIVEQRVAVIVSLTDHMNKATAFWPTEVGGVETFGKVSVKLQNVQLKQNFQTRRFSVSYEHTKTEVTQLQFDVEDSMFSSKTSRSFVELADEMQKESRDSSSRVVLIHCRDGSSKTGTFCAVVNAIERLKLENRVDIFRTVKDLRDCREGMVKTKEQYLFCHQAVIDYLSAFDIYANFR